MTSVHLFIVYINMCMFGYDYISLLIISLFILANICHVCSREICVLLINVNSNSTCGL